QVRLIWGRRWNVIRVTFTLARYVPFIGVAMNTYGKFTRPPNIESLKAFHMISIIAAEGLLIFRTYAFWQQSKKVLIWLLILAAICIAGSVEVTKAVDSLNPPAPGGTPNTTGCVLESGKSSAIQYAFVILFELALMILTVYKRFHFYKDSHSRLVTTLYRDGLVYMACIIMVSVANIFVDLLAPVRLFLPLIVLRPQLVTHGVLASRILLNLRQSRETDSEIIDRIFPLAHASQPCFRCNDNS
ncbi:hypothetical protein M405DRAFT_741907, partial [Rhizopogon salebrosus TDB-379]